VKYFEVTKLIRMQHCDPGGIVFTPQYFQIFIEVLEDWFAQGLDYSFHELVTGDRRGLPARKIVAKFLKPSTMGDVLSFRLHVKRLRRNTALLHMEGSCDGERRCRAELLIGHARLPNVTLSDWPDDLRAKMLAYSAR
jgi:4-hydroxybenzoyl-CoA thioesterase